jgi:sigma-B regulation protein RsbU (phosphoserine phosphatase)
LADNTRPIGVLLDRVDDPYQNELLSGLRVSARARGASMIAFVGGAPGEYVEADPRARVFELAAYARLRGAVVVSATLARRSGRAAPLGIASKLRPMPLVSIGTALAGLPAVLLDNHEGMREIVNHLVTAHERRSIAFVRGPELNDEAEDRYCGYLRALNDHGLPFEQRRVLPGEFDRASGSRAVAELLASGAPFDALIAANDLMALGAIDELRRRGVDVPGTIAVAGFDDLYEAQFGHCPLTTMRQPLGDLAARAVDILLDSGLRRTAVLPAELVRRRSCGCGDLGKPVLPGARSGDHELPLLHRRVELISSMRQVLPLSPDSEWAEDLFLAFVSDARGKTHGAVVEQMQRLLELLAQDNHDLALAHRVVDVLRRGAMPSLAALPGMLLRAETALYGAGLVIANAIRSDSERHGFSLHDAAQVLGSIAHELTLRVGIENVVATLERHLPGLGIASAGLATFRTWDAVEPSWADLEWLWAFGAENAHWWRPQRAGAAVRNAQPFFALAVPLAFDGRLLGLASFEVGRGNGVLFESLRALLSSAVAHASRLTRPTARPSPQRAAV